MNTTSKLSSSLITNYIIFWWELTNILHSNSALINKFWDNKVLQVFPYISSWVETLKQGQFFRSFSYPEQLFKQLHKGLYFTKFKSFRYSISLNRHPGVNYFKFWLKGGALSGRKLLNQLCCFVRNYRLYWFGSSWSLKGFKLIGNSIRFSLFRTVREKRRVIILWGGGLLFDIMI